MCRATSNAGAKSLTMAFYVGRVILAPEMENPTVVVLTDHNDLDDQLFGTFARCREPPMFPRVSLRDSP
jgi:type I restriction enzyme R subunit